MKKVHLIIIAMLSIQQVYAQLNNFVSGNTIEADKINENFNYGKIKWQEKKYIVGNSLSSLNFSNLEVGKTYRITLTVTKGTNSPAVNWSVLDVEGAQNALVGNYFNGTQGRYNSTTRIFKAKTPNLFVTGSLGGTDIGSSILLEELPLHEESSQW